MYTCFNGTYFLDSTTERTIRCLDSKIWTAHVAPCGGMADDVISLKKTIIQRTDKPVAPPETPSEEAKNAEEIGTVFMAILITLAVIIFIMDLPTIYLHVRFFIRNFGNFVHWCQKRCCGVSNEVHAFDGPTTEVEFAEETARKLREFDYKGEVYTFLYTYSI